MDTILIATHLPDRALALELARTLVTERLAACVNVGAPATAVYRWEGAVETAEEIPVSIKTTKARYAEVEARLLALHPYELPELVVVGIEGGLSPYLAWISAETAPVPT
ncbi:MAG: divalent-cation tolerance protein CutA [Betaproteobacteria bacterium]|nr:divalent-cation tolerance protein CutA [Betaproteobacteria bacterium]